jgi:hypothetical protein
MSISLKAMMYWKWVVVGYVLDGLNRAFNIDDTGIVGLLSECHEDPEYLSALKLSGCIPTASLSP